MSNVLGSILIYGHYECLLKTRRWMLERSGYQVKTTMSLEEALAVLANQPIDLLILCHSLAPERRAATIAHAQHCRPDVGLMVLGTHNLKHQTKMKHLIFSVLDNPMDLICSVRTFYSPSSCVRTAA